MTITNHRGLALAYVPQSIYVSISEWYQKLMQIEVPQVVPSRVQYKPHKVCAVLRTVAILHFFMEK